MKYLARSMSPFRSSSPFCSKLFLNTVAAVALVGSAMGAQADDLCVSYPDALNFETIEFTQKEFHGTYRVQVKMSDPRLAKCSSFVYQDEVSYVGDIDAHLTITNSATQQIVQEAYFARYMTRSVQAIDDGTAPTLSLRYNDLNFHFTVVADVDGIHIQNAAEGRNISDAKGKLR